MFKSVLVLFSRFHGTIRRCPYFDTKLDPVRIVMAAPRALLKDGKLPTDRHLVVATESLPRGGRRTLGSMREDVQLHSTRSCMIPLENTW